jgi:hypothetical protein
MTEQDRETHEVIRVFAVVMHKSPYWLSALSTTEDFLSIALEKLESSNLVQSYRGTELLLRLLVKHIWPRMIHVVFDIYNTSYDAGLAHLREYNNLPVVSIYFGRGEARTTLANAGIRDKVNIETANAHNLNGEYSVPPFIEDHTCGTPPMYLNPRNPFLL